MLLGAGNFHAGFFDGSARNHPPHDDTSQSLLAGAEHPHLTASPARVRRGRVLSLWATWSQSAWVRWRRSAPLGQYW